MNIIKLAITRPTVVVVSFTILLLFGLFSYQNLNQELLPKISQPVITVSTLYPGASPAEVEISVSRKIEDAISSLEGIDAISTISMESFSLITAEFKLGIDADLSAQNAQRKINAIRSDMPTGVKEPSVETFDINEAAIMNIGASADIDDSEFFDIVKNEIKPALERIPGVARIGLIGGREREIQINLDEQKLSHYNLASSEVIDLLISSNLDFPTGKIKDEQQQILIRLSGKYRGIEDINNLVVRVYPDGSIVKIEDVAYVSDTEKEIATINRISGVNSIGITVQKQPDANAVIVSGQVKKVLSTIESLHKKSKLTFKIAQNSSEFTLDASNSVLFDLVLAILFVAVAMLLFLHSFKNALIVTIAIPVSLIATFIVMYLLGFTLNLMTLIALSLVVGIVVDDAIVVIENIHRHLEMGKDRVKAAYDGIREIAGTITSITLVIVVVFIPISLTQSLVSELFRQFAVVVAVATLLSLVVSLTMVPLISSRIGKLEYINPKSLYGRGITAFENGLKRFSAGMTSILSWSFNHKLLMFSGVIMLFVASVGLLATGLIGSEFADAGDRGEFYIRLELPKDAIIEETNQLTMKAEDIILNNALVTTTFATVGREEDGQVQPNKSEILVKMVSHKQRDIGDKALAREIKLDLQKQLVGPKITSIPTSLMGGADDAPILLYVVGDELDTVLHTANSLIAEMNKITGINDAEISIKSGNPEIHIELNREKMARLGISFASLGADLNYAFSGNKDSKFLEKDKEYDINIRLDQFDRKSIADIEDFTLINGQGQQVKLNQFADIIETSGPSRLERRNRSTSATISAQAVGRSSGDIAEDVKTMVEEFNLPNSVHIEYGGDMKNQDEGFGAIGMALLISIVLVYLIMVLLYDNYIHPLSVLFSIPLALIGALFALALAQATLSIFTLMGIVMLIGLVAKNAIIVVDFTNQLRKGGEDIKAALIKATKERFRPILMTTIAMIVGMLPIALAEGSGAEWKNGLAWVLIGGLTSSMFLTLIIVPLVYYVLDRLCSKLGLNTQKQRISIDD